MAGRYSKNVLRNMLHSSTYHVVATEGIEKLTVRKVSRGYENNSLLYRAFGIVPVVQNGT